MPACPSVELSIELLLSLRLSKQLTDTRVRSSSRKETLTSLRKQTTTLYSEILKYQIKIARQYSRPGYFRFVRDLVEADPWTTMLKDVIDTEKARNNILDDLVRGSVQWIQDQMSKLALDLAESSKDIKVRNPAVVFLAQHSRRIRTFGRRRS
jgi:N-terminal domain of NWD NACHT-NTPase